MSGGITVEVPEPRTASEWSEPFKLPRSGREVRLREPTVGDMVRAQRTVGRDAVDGEVDLAVAATMAEIDGRLLKYEEIKDLKLRDLHAILEEARRLGFLAPPSTAAGSPPS